MHKRGGGKNSEWPLENVENIHRFRSSNAQEKKEKNIK